MEILIEGSKLDYKIDAEKNLLEVVEYLEEWLLKESKLIERIEADGDALYATDKEGLKERLIEGTNKLEISTVGHGDYALNLLEELEGYIKRFRDETQAERYLSPTNKDEIIEGLKWINDVLLNSARILQIKIDLLFYKDKSLSDIVSKNNVLMVELESYKYNPSVFKELLNLKVKKNLEYLLNYLPKIVERVYFYRADKIGKENVLIVKKVLNDIVDTLCTFIGVIPQIGYTLHTGREAQGYLEIKNLLYFMESLLNDLVVSDKLIGLNEELDIAVEFEGLEEVNKGFGVLLEEISESLIKKDIVLLCDLLEYEVLEKLKVYKRIFEEIIVVIGKKDYS